MAPPPNDNFANAIPIVWDDGTISTTFGEATKQTGEPQTWADQSAWYSFDPPVSGGYRFTSDLVNSSLAVYVGSAVNALTQVDQDNTENIVDFYGASGTTYYIQVIPYNDLYVGDIETGWEQIVDWRFIDSFELGYTDIGDSPDESKFLIDLGFGDYDIAEEGRYVIVGAFAAVGDPDQEWRPINSAITPPTPQPSPVSCTDSKGNTYELQPGSGRLGVFISKLETTLVPDDEIIVTWSMDLPEDVYGIINAVSTGDALDPDAIGNATAMKMIADSGPGGRSPPAVWRTQVIEDNEWTNPLGLVITTPGWTPGDALKMTVGGATHNTGVVWGNTTTFPNVPVSGVANFAWLFDSTDGTYVSLNADLDKDSHVQCCNDDGVAIGYSRIAEHPNAALVAEAPESAWESSFHATTWEDGVATIVDYTTYTPPVATGTWHYISSFGLWITQAGEELISVEWGQSGALSNRRRTFHGWTRAEVDESGSSSSYECICENPDTGEVALTIGVGSPIGSGIITPGGTEAAVTLLSGHTDHQVLEMRGEAGDQTWVGWSRDTTPTPDINHPIIWTNGTPAIYSFSDLTAAGTHALWSFIDEGGTDTLGGGLTNGSFYNATYLRLPGDTNHWFASTGVHSLYPNASLRKEYDGGFTWWPGTAGAMSPPYYPAGPMIRLREVDGEFWALVQGYGIGAADAELSVLPGQLNACIMRRPTASGVTCSADGKIDWPATSGWESESMRFQIGFNIALNGEQSGNCYSEDFAWTFPGFPTMEEVGWESGGDFSYVARFGIYPVRYEMETLADYGSGALAADPNPTILLKGRDLSPTRTRTFVDDDGLGSPYFFLGYSIPAYIPSMEPEDPLGWDDVDAVGVSFSFTESPHLVPPEWTRVDDPTP